MPGPGHLRRRGRGDPGLTAVAAFEQALTAAGVEHRIETYEGAPHSFFDRKAADFADCQRSGVGRDLGFMGVAR